MIRFEVDVPPSTNNLYANASGRRVKSATYTRWISHAGWEAKSQTAGEAISGPWKISIAANLNGRRDISNIIKPIEDLAVRLNLVTDDRHCQEVRAIRCDRQAKNRALVTLEQA